MCPDLPLHFLIPFLTLITLIHYTHSFTCLPYGSHVSFLAFLHLCFRLWVYSDLQFTFFSLFLHSYITLSRSRIHRMVITLDRDCLILLSPVPSYPLIIYHCIPLPSYPLNPYTLPSDPLVPLPSCTFLTRFIVLSAVRQSR